jgi:folylpolyglutamate synthase/dihydropteroate synthase
LNSFVNHEQQRIAVLCRDAQPDRVCALLERMADPQLSNPAIHIAGTKGKG